MALTLLGTIVTAAGATPPDLRKAKLYAIAAAMRDSRMNR
jgi:hypothetical protein